MMKEDAPWLGQTQKNFLKSHLLERLKKHLPYQFYQNAIPFRVDKRFSEEHRLLFLGEIRKKKVNT